jgi:hypothetical protein
MVPVDLVDHSVMVGLRHQEALDLNMKQIPATRALYGS